MVKLHLIQSGPRPSAPSYAPAESLLDDLRFRALLGADAWSRLPDSVRKRFSKRLTDQRAAIYAGEIVETRMSRLGWLLAQAMRFIGGPLPLHRDAEVPATVSVTEDTPSNSGPASMASAGGFPK